MAETTPIRALELIPLATRAGGSLLTSNVIAPIAGHDRLLLRCIYDEGADRDADAVRVIGEYNDGRAWREFIGYTWRGGAPGADLIRVMGVADPAMSIPIPLGVRVRDMRFHMEGLKGARTKLDLATAFANEKFAAGQKPQSVAYDSVGSTDFANVSSASYTHTFSGTPTGICVGVCTGQFPADNSTVSGVTVNGSAAASEGTATLTTGAGVPIRSTVFTLASPSTGTVAVTFNVGGHYGGAGSIGVVGGDTSDVADGFNSANASSGNPSVAITSTSGDMPIDWVAAFTVGGPTLTVGASQTDRVNRINAGSNTRIGGSTEPGDTSVTMSWTQSAGEWVTCGVNMRQGAAAGNRRRRILICGASA